MSWSEGDTLRLIEAYKKRPLLWDLKHPLHYHKERRNNAWVELSAEVNRSIGECKKKWDGLLASFRREKAKMRRGGEEGYTSWYAFEPLLFLLDKNKPRDYLNMTFDMCNNDNSFEETVSYAVTPSSPTTSTKDFYRNAEDEATCFTHITDEQNFTETKENVSSQVSSIKVLRNKDQQIKTDAEIIQLVKVSDVMESLGSHRERDANEDFGYFVTSQLRLIKSPERQMKLRHKIMIAIMEAQNDEMDKS